MLAGLALLALLPQDPQATYHSSDQNPIFDPQRPVTQISRDSFSLQYFTSRPCETVVEVREGVIPRAAFGHKPDGQTRLVRKGDKPTALHTLTVTGLKAGKRYYYRVLDPGPKTQIEQNWGADSEYRREFAVSTQAPKGEKTIIHLPVKVLLMPNVINVESAYQDKNNPAPLPSRMTKAEIEKIKSEFDDAARFFWVNSGMRLWVDWQFFVDERWQRWGPEPARVDAFYRGWPASRSYPGRDFAPPGGGDFTILDTRDPLKVTKQPVVEPKPYSGQVEMAWPRRWNPTAKKWEFYNSGGGTYGVDGFPDGFPGRSQFLGGGDSAWLATHEFHHNLESHGAFSLGNREDDRIVFNHYAARHRTVKPDGSVDENTWTTSGRHGEHWDGMAFWDRQLTDAQWLRMYFGYTTTTRDSDGDGFPDEDLRLPLDEKRFGSDPRKPATDGQMGDLQKVMLSTWVPGPLQTSWIKPAFQGIRPNPTKPDTDGDGIADTLDPYPLYPHAPVIVPLHATIDGDISEWKDVPVAGSISKGGIHFTFKQAHDASGYYGLYEVKGPWRRIDGTFDGEGQGVYSGAGVLGFQVTSAPSNPNLVDIRPSFGGAPGLKLKALKQPDGAVAIEFRLPNRGEGPWFWNRGGREIGAVLSIADDQGRMFSVWEPYRPFYARMLEPYGKEPLPSGAPAELSGGTVLKPGDPQLKVERGWTLSEGKLKHSGEESAVYVEGLEAKDFDLLAVIEGKSDGILGAFTKNMRQMNAGVGYIAFIGGYGNTVSKMRLFGHEAGEDATVLSPGVHRIQFSRRDGDMWVLFDGKPILWAADPNPKAIIDRLAVLGGYGGNQVLHELRYRVGP